MQPSPWDPEAESAFSGLHSSPACCILQVPTSVVGGYLLEPASPASPQGFLPTPNASRLYRSRSVGPVQLTCTVAQPGSGQTPAGGAGSCSSQSALATPSVCALESCPPPPAQCRDPPSFFGELGGRGGSRQASYHPGLISPSAFLRVISSAFFLNKQWGILPEAPCSGQFRTLAHGCGA